MKIKLDENKLREKMKEKGIKSLKELAEYCGIPKATVYTGRHRHRALSKESLWLISEGLDCSINDIVYADWGDGA